MVCEASARPPHLRLRALTHRQYQDQDPGAPAWWHADLCEEQKASSQQGSCRGRLQGPGKILAGDVCEAVVRLAHSKFPPPCHRSSTSTSLPAWQAPAWWHADLREDPATALAQRLGSQLGIACLVIQDACQDGVRQR